jgi:predicted dehydrogenase
MSSVRATSIRSGARAAKRWKVPVFAEFDAMLDAARPEVVIVATPPDTHAEYCLRSLDVGAHVICEKPFVSSVEEAGWHVTGAMPRFDALQ